MSVETIYDGIQTYIIDYLEPYLDEEDNITTPMFKNIMRSSVFDILGLKIYPTLMMEYGAIQITRETTGSDRYILPISFYAISMGGDAEVLQKKSERYVWALKTMFEEDISLGSLVDQVDIQGIEFSPALTRQNTFVHVGILHTSFDVLINR